MQREDELLPAGPAGGGLGQPRRLCRAQGGCPTGQRDQLVHRGLQVGGECGGVVDRLGAGRGPPPGGGHRRGDDVQPVDLQADQPFDSQQLGAGGVDRRPQPRQLLLVLGDLPGERIHRDRLPSAGRGQPWRDHRRAGEPVGIHQQLPGDPLDQLGFNPLAKVVHLVPGLGRGQFAAKSQILPWLRGG